MSRTASLLLAPTVVRCQWQSAGMACSPRRGAGVGILLVIIVVMLCNRCCCFTAGHPRLALHDIAWAPRKGAPDTAPLPVYRHVFFRICGALDRRWLPTVVLREGGDIAGFIQRCDGVVVTGDNHQMTAVLLQITTEAVVELTRSLAANRYRKCHPRQSASPRAIGPCPAASSRTLHPAAQLLL